MKKIITSIILFYSFTPLSAGDDFCSIHNHSFQNGESISYTVFYSIIGLYVNAGSANFTTRVENMNNKTAYHVVAVGSSNPSYDWIFKVRDRYESYFDTSNIQPLKFTRSVEEAGRKMSESVLFNQHDNTATTNKGVFKVPGCIQDVLSAIYYARNINFSKYNVNDKIPFDMFLEDEVHPLYLRYLGKEIVKTRYGKFNSIKFSPLLVKGTIFAGGEKMTVWVSDDANHVPLRIESHIIGINPTITYTNPNLIPLHKKFPLNKDFILSQNHNNAKHKTNA